MILDKYKLQYEKPRIRKKRVYNTKAINKGNQSHKTWLMSLHKLSILIVIALLVAVSVALYQLRDYKIDTIGHVEAQIEAPEQTETIETTETPPEVKQEPKKAVNDPQGCEPEQYWDKNPPHNCIDKPKPAVQAKKPVSVGSGSCHAEIIKYDWNHNVATAVMMAESGGNPSALNNNPKTGDYSVGCFQINLYGANARTRPSEATLKNAEANVAFAYKIYVSNGRSFKGQWGVCRYISCY